MSMAHNVHDPDVLKRVNAFTFYFYERIFNPQAVDELKNKLMRILKL